MLSFDFLLEKVGGVGLYQIVVCVLLSYISVVGGYHSLATVFIAYESDYRCNVPPLDNLTAYPNLTESDILNYTTPYDQSSEEYNTCSKYSYEYAECDGTLSCVNMSANHIPCDQGYWYDRSLFTETVVTEFNLVCGRSYLIPLSTSMYYVGWMVGSFVFGNAADRFGRKPTMIVAVTLAVGSMFVTTYSRSVEMYTVFRAFVACFRYGAVIGAYVYIIEIVGIRWRTIFGMTYQIFFALGYMALGGMAYYWRNWHNLMLVVTLFSAPVLIIVTVLPESPRWLFAMEKDREGIRVTKLMARINKKSLSDEVWDQAREAGEEKMKEALQQESTKKYSYLDLFKTPGLRTTTFKVMFIWFVNSMVYYGVALNAGSLAGDIFVNNTLNGVFEIASYVACMLLMDKTGRRILLALMFLVSGCSLIASVIVNEYAGDDQSLLTLGVVFAFVAKFGISGSFAVIYNFTTELYPTVVRSNGFGNGSVASRIGGISAPYIISLQSSISWLPNSIFGISALVACALSLTFPETNGKPMMETIEQAEIFYKTGKVVNLDNLGDDRSVTSVKNAKLSTVIHQNNRFSEDDLTIGVRL